MCDFRIKKCKRLSFQLIEKFLLKMQNAEVNVELLSFHLVISNLKTQLHAEHTLKTTVTIQLKEGCHEYKKMLKNTALNVYKHFHHLPLNPWRHLRMAHPFWYILFGNTRLFVQVYNKKITNKRIKKETLVNFTNILSVHLRQYFCAKKVQTYNISTKKLCAKLLYKKVARKMLVKLTHGRRYREH